MGMTKPIEEYEKDTLSSLGLKYKGLKWCELGNQRTDEKKVAKEIYLSLGVEHISIDLNGEDGAIPIDLDKPVPVIFLNQFNVITNYGTIEHINNQFQVFKNVHDMCKQEGIMIHVLSPTGNWPGHCRYYYSEKFVRELARDCGYKIFNYKILDKSVHKSPNNVIVMTYIKKENNEFITKNEFEQIEGITDSGDLAHTGNYTNRKVLNRQVIKHILKKVKKFLF